MSDYPKIGDIIDVSEHSDHLHSKRVKVVAIRVPKRGEYCLYNKPYDRVSTAINPINEYPVVEEYHAPVKALPERKFKVGDRVVKVRGDTGYVGLNLVDTIDELGKHNTLRLSSCGMWDMKSNYDLYKEPEALPECKFKVGDKVTWICDDNREVRTIARIVPYGDLNPDCPIWTMYGEYSIIGSSDCCTLVEADKVIEPPRYIPEGYEWTGELREPLDGEWAVAASKLDPQPSSPTSDAMQQGNNLHASTPRYIIKEIAKDELVPSVWVDDGKGEPTFIGTCFSKIEERVLANITEAVITGTSTMRIDGNGSVSNIPKEEIYTNLNKTKESKTMKISKVETVQRINDSDASTYSDAELLTMIKDTEAEIKGLKEIDITSKKVATMITDMEDSLKKVVKILDARK